MLALMFVVYGVAGCWCSYGGVVGGVAECWCSIVVSLIAWHVASWRYCAGVGGAGCSCVGAGCWRSHDGVVGGVAGCSCALRVALSVVLVLPMV